MLPFTRKDPILTAVQLKKLKEHKYSASSASLFDPILQHWWNWLVKQVPVWLAPNLITILGLIVNILTSLILIYYSPDCKREVPGWACYLCALGLFVYQSLDAIDGKQARRTNSSSPLGELFDHGCDSISTVFVSLAVCVSVQLGTAPKLMFLQCFCAITLFYCAHWQTYVSGTLRFGFIDVTEAQMGIIIVHLVSGYYGCSFWTKSEIMHLPVAALPTLLALPVAIWSLVQTLKVIFTGGVGKNGSTVALFPDSYLPLHMIYAAVALSGALRALVWDFQTILYKGAGKNGSSVAGTSVLSPVIPFSLVLVPAMMLAGNGNDGIYATHPAIYIMTFGLIAARVTNRLVVAHMTKSEMEYMDSSLLGPFLMSVNQYFNTPVSEKYLLYFSLFWVCIDLWLYCSKVCIEICDSMDIHLFRIKPPSSIPEKSGSSTLSSSAKKTDFEMSQVPKEELNKTFKVAPSVDKPSQLTPITKTSKSFSGELQRRCQCKVIMISSPKVDMHIVLPSEEDVDSAFGFDESIDDFEFSEIISPIPTVGPKHILPPLEWKVGGTGTLVFSSQTSSESERAESWNRNVSGVEVQFNDA